MTLSDIAAHAAALRVKVERHKHVDHRDAALIATLVEAMALHIAGAAAPKVEKPKADK